MTNEGFNAQIGRLRLRFGEKAFDPEFLRELVKEANTLSDYDFQKIVADMIGSRPHSRPPLIVDFREARLQIEKQAMNKLAKQAFESMTGPRDNIEQILTRHGYAGCKTPWEAVECQILRNKFKKADEAANE